eukprot:6013319-Pyramimonas_sp.AAC.1
MNNAWIQTRAWRTTQPQTVANNAGHGSLLMCNAPRKEEHVRYHAADAFGGAPFEATTRVRVRRSCRGGCVRYPPAGPPVGLPMWPRIV